MKKIELLAPAGSMESLYASVAAGADAVYIGGSKFSARAYAENFSDDTIKEAVDYCHVYGVKVYVTVNTLIKEDEMKEALNYARFLYKAGVDALIIQDIGLYSNIKKIMPAFEMHASTQMTIHNGEGALFLKECGFKRIVLSRELNLDEIKYISADLGVETEIFVHGALCVCYSGQCLMSSIIGGRSGNRGRCAQPCRLPYTLIDKKNGRERKGYILSTKDICTIEYLKDIIESGTASLKIEGRMKRPEYVCGAVMSYRKALDGTQKNIKESSFNPQKEKDKLLQLFNREGFSKGYFYGNAGHDMMAYNYPKNTGIQIGRVNEKGEVVLKCSIALKDGLRNGEEGFTVSKIMADGVSVNEALKGDAVKIFPEKYKTNDDLYKTSDISFLKELKNVYSNPYSRKIEIAVKVIFSPDKPFNLSVNYDGRYFSYDGDIVQKARNNPLTMKNIEENIKKSGNVAIKLSRIEFSEFNEGFLPLSSINCARREIIHLIEDYEKQKCKKSMDCHEFSIDSINGGIDKVYQDIPKFLVCVNTEEQYTAALKSNAEAICINVFMRDWNIEIEKLNNKKMYIKVPNIIRKEFDHVCSVIEKNINNIEGIVTGNLGILRKFKNRIKIIGDYKLNIFNSAGIEFYSRFIDGMCLSVELNKKEIKETVCKTSVPLQVLCYGKIELMVSEYCAAGSILGGRSGSKDCSGVCKEGEYYIKDRTGTEFLIKNDKFCRSYIYNSVPLNLSDNICELKNIGINHYRMDFTDENYDETFKIINGFQNFSDTSFIDKYTRGHYKRGVE